MDILPMPTKTKNSPPFSGLREWCTLSSRQELEGDTSQPENRRCYTPKDESIHLEFPNQTLVEYLSQKLERCPYKSPAVDLDLDNYTSSSRQLNKQIYQKYLEGMRMDDTYFSGKGRLMNSVTSLRLNSRDTRWTRGKGKTQPANKHTGNNKAKTAMEKSDQGRLSNVYKAYLSPSGSSPSSKSNTSMTWLVSPVKVEPNRQSVGLGLPGQYVIGRHFHILLKNLKNRTSSEPLTFTQGAHQTKSSNKIDTFDFKNTKWRCVDKKPINLKSLRSVGKSRKLRRNHQENTQYTGRFDKSKNVKKSKHFGLSLHSQTVETELSPGDSPTEGPSCVSRAPRGKPLRTSLKTTCQERRQCSEKRSVRFESFLDLCQNVTPNENKTTDNKTQECPTEATAEQCPALRSSLMNCSNSSSPVQLASARLRQSSSEEGEQASLYKRLGSQNDTSSDYCRSDRASRPSRHQLENEKSITAFPHRRPHIVPNRRSYTRLRNHSESRTVLINISNKSQ